VWWEWNGILVVVPRLRGERKQRRYLLLGEPNLTVADIESSNDVLKEDITDDPTNVANVTRHDATNAIGGALLSLTKGEELGVDSEVGSTEGEGDGGNGVARNGEETLADVISSLGTGNGLVELGDRGVVTDDLDKKKKRLSEFKNEQGVRKTYEGRASVDDSSHLAKGSLATDGDGVHIDRPETFFSDRSEDEIALSALCTTERKLSPAFRELERKDRLGDRSLPNQSLEEGRSLEFGDTLETHTHQPIRLEVLGAEAIRVLLSSTDSLVGSGETGNGDGVSEDFARDGGAVTELGLETFACVLGGGRPSRIIDGVAGAAATTVSPGEKKVGATGVEVDCVEEKNRIKLKE
jgi:hypothetical protein